MNIELIYPNLDQFEKTELEELSRQVANLKLQKLKYQLMWSLRQLENDIVKEGGKIVLDINGIRLISGFSDGLSKKIMDLYKEWQKNDE